MYHTIIRHWLRSLSPSFYRADLLHDTELIRDEPFFYNLAVAQAKDSDSSNCHLLAGGTKGFDTGVSHS